MEKWEKEEGDAEVMVQMMLCFISSEHSQDAEQIWSSSSALWALPTELEGFLKRNS